MIYTIDEISRRIRPVAENTISRLSISLAPMPAVRHGRIVISTCW